MTTGMDLLLGTARARLGGRRVGLLSHQAALTASGLSAPITDIRVEMWTKLLGNIYANPICALTRVPLGPAIAHPATRMLAVRLMQECKSVAAAHAITNAPGCPGMGTAKRAVLAPISVTTASPPC